MHAHSKNEIFRTEVDEFGAAYSGCGEFRETKPVKGFGVRVDGIGLLDHAAWDTNVGSGLEGNT